MAWRKARPPRGAEGTLHAHPIGFLSEHSGALEVQCRLERGMRGGMGCSDGVTPCIAAPRTTHCNPLPQAEAGDVLALRACSPGRVSFLLWRAGSEAAQRFLAHERATPFTFIARRKRARAGAESDSSRSESEGSQAEGYADSQTDDGSDSHNSSQVDSGSSPSAAERRRGVRHGEVSGAAPAGTPPVRRRKGWPGKWRGLDPSDSHHYYSMPLSRNAIQHKQLSIPGESTG